MGTASCERIVAFISTARIIIRYCLATAVPPPGDPFLEPILMPQDDSGASYPSSRDRGDVALVTLQLRAENVIRATNAALGIADLPPSVDETMCSQRRPTCAALIAPDRLRCERPAT